jgi:hypothetical protein
VARDMRQHWTGSHYMTTSERVASRVQVIVTLDTPASQQGRKVWVRLSPDEAKQLGESLIRHADNAVKPASDRT